MESAIRQSLAMCPYMKRTGPAALKALSVNSPSAIASPVFERDGQHCDHMKKAGNGRKTGLGVKGTKSILTSNLQRLASNCPVMGQAMAVQMAKMRFCSRTSTRGLHSKMNLRGLPGSAGNRAAVRTAMKLAAGMQTGRPRLARAMDTSLLETDVKNGKHLHRLY